MTAAAAVDTGGRTDLTATARALRMLPAVLELIEKSPLHFLNPVHLLFDHVFPSLVNDQFRLIVRHGQPAAFVNWAWLSPEVSAQYASAQRYVLRPEDWRSGPELWFCEIVAREGMMYALVNDLQRNVFPAGTRGRWLRFGPSGEFRGVGEVRLRGARAPVSP